MKITTLDLAFLRAVVQGVPIDDAAPRYLGVSSVVASKLKFKAFVDELSRRARAKGRPELGSVLRRSASNLRGRQTHQLRIREEDRAAAGPLSFDDWRKTFDADAFGERELPGLYQVYCTDFGAVGSPQVARRAGRPELSVDDQRERLIERQLQAIEWLSMNVADVPLGSDALEGWLPERAARGLVAIGIITLDQLRGWIDLKGKNWFRKVPGVGPTAAATIRKFFSDYSVVLQSLGASSHLTLREQPLVRVPSVNASISPLELLVVPVGLEGEGGRNRAPLGALSMHDDQDNLIHDDLGAIRQFLRTRSANRHTLRAYTKEVERFYLYCLFERRVALSHVGLSEMVSYRAWLRDIPSAWCASPATERSDIAWRPFVRSLGPSSHHQAMTIVGGLLRWLVEVGYLRMNPMAGMGVESFTAPRRATEKALSKREWEILWTFAKTRGETPRERRIRAAIGLLYVTGLRSQELIDARRGQFEFRLPDELEGSEGMTILKVQGKGNKEREVGLSTVVLGLLEAHWADFKRVAGRFVDFERPLLLSQHGALSYSGLYDDLDTFIGSLVVGLMDSNARLASRFMNVSPHSLRHTHAVHLLAKSGGDLKAAQEQLGHASINTTAIYIHAGVSRRVKLARDMDAELV